jgi:hypothetical protein
VTSLTWIRIWWTGLILCVIGAIVATFTLGWASSLVGNFLDGIIIAALWISTLYAHRRLDMHAALIAELAATSRAHLAITNEINQRLNAQEFGSESTR